MNRDIQYYNLDMIISVGYRVHSLRGIQFRMWATRTLKASVPVAAALAYMVFVLLYFPCIATFVAIKNETGKWRWAVLVCLYAILVAWMCAFVAFRLGLLVWGYKAVGTLRFGCKTGPL